MKIIKILAILAVLVGLGALVSSFTSTSGTMNISESGSAASTSVSASQVAPGGLYTNTKYGFSVTLPAGFSSREIASGAEGSESIMFENGKGDGVQIMITPFDDVRVLTADMIKKDIPDMKMDQVQTVDVGESYKGVAFLSDSPEFGGSSRDVWFVFKGNLYQISTYARLDSLLQSIFSTWQFTQ